MIYIHRITWSPPPSRLPRSPEAQHRAESKAAAKVARDGPFRVLRLPRLAPALFCKDDVGPSAANRAASLARIRVQGEEHSHALHPRLLPRVCVSKPISISLPHSRGTHERRIHACHREFPYLPLSPIPHPHLIT